MIKIKGIPIKEDRFSLLQNIVNELELHHFQGDNGPLESNPAFISLKEQAEAQLKEPKFILCLAKYPNVGFLKSGLIDAVSTFWGRLSLWEKYKWRYHLHNVSESINFLDEFEKNIAKRFMGE